MELHRRSHSGRLSSDGYTPSLSELSGGESRGSSRRRDRERSNENFKVNTRHTHTPAAHENQSAHEKWRRYQD